METKFTPGPWNRDAFVIKAARGTVAKVPSPRVDGVFECDANAHLIAAAPELYEALERAMAFMPAGKEGSSEVYNAAYRALKKARGE